MSSIPADVRPTTTGTSTTAAATDPPATSSTPTTTTTTAAAVAVDGQLAVEVVRTMPHDPESFTQGYVLAGGRLYESTGLYGESSLREIDPTTGEVLRSVAVDGAYFAEGLELVGDRLVLLTWREETALVYDAETFELVDELHYEGEGWGLCELDHRLVMSDGTDRLTFRDPADLAPLGSVDVRDGPTPIARLNELECVEGEVWANVWQTDLIVRIDPASGQVLSTVDASALLPADQRAGADVLNGIAHVEGTDRFVITGKWWPLAFEVRFVAAPAS